MSQKRLDDSNGARLEVYCAHVQFYLLSPPLLFTSKLRVSLEHYLAHCTSYLLSWFRGASLGAEVLVQQYMNTTQGLTL